MECLAFVEKYGILNPTTLQDFECPGFISSMALCKEIDDEASLWLLHQHLNAFPQAEAMGTAKLTISRKFETKSKTAQYFRRLKRMRCVFRNTFLPGATQIEG